MFLIEPSNVTCFAIAKQTSSVDVCIFLSQSGAATSKYNDQASDSNKGLVLDKNVSDTSCQVKSSQVKLYLGRVAPSAIGL